MGTGKMRFFSIAELYEEVDEDHALRLYSLVYNNGANPAAFRTKALMQFGDLSLRKGDRLAALNAFNRILSEDADSVAVLLAKEKITFINDSDSVSETENHPQ